MAATRRLSELITATLSKVQLPTGPVVVALSGGADSAALALLVREAGHVLSALHIDHQLPASPMLADAAAAVAAQLDIAIDVESVTIGDGPSLEERARDARYQVFGRSRLPVLTAHTRDDSVETMLINLIRGTGVTGLTGIPRFRSPRVHRPMLDVSRDETREIAVLAGLGFVDDPMNEDLSLTRNRVRLRLLPLMRELNPQVDTALARASAALERDSDHLEAVASRLAADASDVAVPMSVIATIPRPLADRLLRRLLERNGIGPTADRIERMWSVATGASERQDLADGRSVIRHGALLVVE